MEARRAVRPAPRSLARKSAAKSHKRQLAHGGVAGNLSLVSAAKNTVLKLLADVGNACDEYQDKHVRNLPCARVQCDETWPFCYAKQKNVPDEEQGKFGYGDVWTWTAIDADSKLVITWAIGGRHAGYARELMNGLADRLAHCTQLTTDGRHAYLDAVPRGFGDNVDYAMLVQMYGPDTQGNGPEREYSPGECNGTRKRAIIGNPQASQVSTSFAERQNLTMRMSMRRFTRLTNAFSKKIENLVHAVALHFLHYNSRRKHQTLNKTPAQAAGLADHQWSVEGILDLMPSN